MVRLVDIRRWLDQLDAIVIYGAGRDILKPKKNSGAVKYFLGRLVFSFLSFLDRLDSKIFFRSRNVKTPLGRVRSRGERKIVMFFQKHGIQFTYEPLLVLGKVKLHPDFFLPEYGVYVEFWGMAYISPRYRAIMRLKKKLYKRHGIKVVSLFPEHLADLESKFPNQLKKITGKPVTLNISKGGEQKTFS